MKFSSFIGRVKYYFILNRSTLSKYGIYQMGYYMYRYWYNILAKYNSLGGKNVYCPVCHYTGRKYIRNKMCPRCWSGSRHRLLALYINNKHKLPFDRRILEVGPNIATSSYIFDRNIYPKYLSIDLDSPISDIHMDITNLGVKNNVIDLIVCFHVLSEIKDDKKAMHELYRVLKNPGGIAIIQGGLLSDPSAHTIESNDFDGTTESANLKRRKNFENINLYGHPSCVRVYGKIDFLAKLKSVGFHVEVDYYAISFSEEDIIKFGLQKNEPLIICEKIQKE